MSADIKKPSRFVLRELLVERGLEIRLNRLTGQLCVDKWPADILQRDGELLAVLTSYVHATLGLETTKSDVESVIWLLAVGNSYDPMEEHILNLPAWDGTPRLDSWLRDYLDAKGEDEYLSYVGRYVFTAMARRALSTREPVKADASMLLIGLHDSESKRVVRAIGGEFAVTSVDMTRPLSGYEFNSDLSGASAFALPGSEVFTGRNAKALKAATTRTEAWVRAPYGSLPMRFLRRGVIIAYDRARQPLVDSTGNRRWLPVVPGKGRNLEGLEAIQGQLLAEAVAKDNGAPLVPPQSLYGLLSAVQEAHRTPTEEEVRIETILKSREGRVSLKGLLLGELHESFCDLGKQRQYSRAMRRIASREGSGWALDETGRDGIALVATKERE